MSSLYFVQVEFKSGGLPQKDFLLIFLEEVKFYLAEKEKGSVKQVWKSVAENRMLLIVEGSSEAIDKMMFNTPVMLKLSQHTTVNVKPVLPYDVFARNFDAVTPLPKGTCTDAPANRGVADDSATYVWLEVAINHIGHSRDDFLKWEAQEIAAAMGAWRGGLILDGWKSVGEFPIKIIFVVRMNSPSALDDIFYHLPLFVNNGENVTTKVTPIREGKSVVEKLEQLTSN